MQRVRCACQVGHSVENASPPAIPENGSTDTERAAAVRVERHLPRRVNIGLHQVQVSRVLAHTVPPASLCMRILLGCVRTQN